MISGREIVAGVVTILSVGLILVEYFLPLRPDEFLVILVIDGLMVVFLAADLWIRANSSGKPGSYILRNWYEVIALVPLAFFYFLETQTILGAFLRALRLTRILRLLLVIARTGKSITYFAEVLKRSRLLYLLIVSAIVVFAGTLAAFLLEVGMSGSKINDLGDAFWWALATVTTVGYGDVVPVTVAGRVIGAFLMITGIAVLGVFISSLGAALLSTPATKTSINDELKSMIKNRVDELEKLSDEDLAQLIEIIRSLHRHSKVK